MIVYQWDPWTDRETSTTGRVIGYERPYLILWRPMGTWMQRLDKARPATPAEMYACFIGDRLPVQRARQRGRTAR